MQTPWGEIEVQDAHAHFFGQSFFKALAVQKGVSDVAGMVTALGWDLPPDRNEDLARRWAEELDRHGVAKSVLMASVPGDEAAVGDAVQTFPDRFYGYFMLNPLAKGALERAKTAFEELSLQGLCLFPAMQGFSVQDARLGPLYELASQADNRVVFVHMGVLTRGHSSQARPPLQVQHELLESHRLARRRNGSPRHELCAATLRRGLLSRSAHACVLVTERLPRHLQQQQLEEIPDSATRPA